jgi:hypothetical protein
MSTNGKKEKPDDILLEQVRELKKDNSREGNTAEQLGEKRRLSEPLSDDEAKRRMRSLSRRGFLIGGAAAVFGYLGYGWLKQPENFPVFQRVLKFNEDLSQLYYSPKHLAPEFPRSSISMARVNGGEGMNDDFDPATWKLQVVGVANQNSYSQYNTDLNYEGISPLASGSERSPLSGLLLTLDDIKRLPRVEMTTELKCIEGWSIIVNWVGARFSDFVAAYQPQFTKYVGIVTPDEGYYVGWDMPSILHPQTLLAYEMNGAPLTMEHGAPLRLVSTVKYGIKQIKRIGRIEFTDARPPDFWAEQGYDWYSGH